MNHCIFKVTNEIEEKEDEVVCLSGAKELEKQVNKPAGRQKKKRERSKVYNGSTIQLSRFT